MTEITLLDGSIGQEILKRSGDRPTPLWSTQVMMDHPGIVDDIHRDYFRAGATIATTNSYAIHRDRLVMGGLDPEQFPDLIDRALSEAEAARAAHGAGRIAAALGPLIASYRPDICPPPHEAQIPYAELVALMEERVDMFLIETASSVEQAEGAMMGTAKTGKPVWLAISVRDDDGRYLRSGEPVGDMKRIVDDYAPAAVLVNCSRPEAVTSALETVREFGLPFGGYANGFVQISDGFLQEKPTADALKARTDLGPAAYAAFAMTWVRQGATIIGGCCEVGPDHIAEIARQLTAAGHDIV